MNATQYATAFIFYIVVARILSPSEVGPFSLLLMIMAVFNTLTPIELFVRTSIYLKAFVEASAFVVVALLAFELVKPLDDHEIGLLKAAIPWKAKIFNSSQSEQRWLTRT
jgi:hypothetical protein